MVLLLWYGRLACYGWLTLLLWLGLGVWSPAMAVPSTAARPRLAGGLAWVTAPKAPPPPRSLRPSLGVCYGLHTPSGYNQLNVYSLTWMYIYTLRYYLRLAGWLAGWLGIWPVPGLVRSAMVGWYTIRPVSGIDSVGPKPTW